MTEAFDADDELRQLLDQYAGSLPGKVHELQGLWQAIGEGWAPEQVQDLIRRTHDLAGSAGSYGFPAVSQAARVLEAALKAHMPPAPPPGETGRLRVAAGLATLQDLVGSAAR